MLPPRLGSRLELELVDPSRNARRGYRLEVAVDPQLPLFAGETRGVLLVLSWGRLGARRQVLRRRYRTLEELAADWERVLAVRRRHGYVELSSTLAT